MTALSFRSPVAKWDKIKRNGGIDSRDSRDCGNVIKNLSFKGRHQEWLSFSKFQATIREALEKLNDLVDESDPDTELPNIVHAFQTAERARAEFPDLDWLHLVGLIHDLGKVMAFYGEPQWAVVGDTFPVGCEWSKNIVYREDSFEGNVDGEDARFK